MRAGGKVCVCVSLISLFSTRTSVTILVDAALPCSTLAEMHIVMFLSAAVQGV